MASVICGRCVSSMALLPAESLLLLPFVLSLSADSVLLDRVELVSAFGGEKEEDVHMIEEVFRSSIFLAILWQRVAFGAKTKSGLWMLSMAILQAHLSVLLLPLEIHNEVAYLWFVPRRFGVRCLGK